ncbi:serine-rich adhesin for platelets-like [Mercenaria mercenaria]|uniref:serine-rich adhesin for platelets-like n=1 Tax=Mercenaria mercenaria TaxID=6596 RepID=UPI00234E80BD|nr:serine-rich adhesin for platelets-like [Mercenaria mercenaria]
MASKEPKNIKRFPKRLLSSFRRGKKVHLQTGKNELHTDSDERAGFTSYDLENAQNENATIDLEATIVLNTPRKSNSSGRSTVDALVTPKRNLRNVIAEDSNEVADNFPTPRVERLVLGGPMSASADSGIDCSILLSEKNSPEQFVAFTRREAERLRQEQLHNASVLETLTEADRSSSEDGDIEHVTDKTKNIDNRNDSPNDNVMGAEGGFNVKESTNEVCDHSDICDTLQPPSACIGTPQTVEAAGQNSHVPECNNLDSVDGDYVFLTENIDNTVSQLVDVTSFTSDNRNHEQDQSDTVRSSKSSNQSGTVTSLCNRLENEPAHSTDTYSQTLNTDEIINVDNCYMHYYANRTDEIKSAEARLRQDQSAGAVLQLAATHNIVDPVPVVTSSIATHRVLQSTPSPARLYVNENSAFAKCKSLKRSVSDVGKGILGRLRHRSKDGRAPKDESICVDDEANTALGKKSGFNKLKKLGVKIEKRNSRIRHSSAQSATSKIDTDCVSNSQTNLKKKQSVKSPVVKEICAVGEKMMDESSSNFSKTKQSPVYKEILSDNVKQELEASFQRQCSSAVTESIQDMTSSISQMTSALCASSAESIACICDCKNRYSDPECCEKRKTPSPLESTVFAEQKKTLPLADGEYLEITECDIDATEATSSEQFESNMCDTCTISTNENEITEYSPLVNRNHTLRNEDKFLPEPNSSFCDENIESSDESSDEIYHNYYSDDNDNNSSDECSDLDCSNCCNASPNTGNRDCLSSSSDSECSITDSCENLSAKCKEMGSSRSSSQSSSSSSVISRLSAQNSESLSSSSSGTSSPVVEDSSFNTENSSFSVSFKEIDFENGDVMYVENNVSSDFEDGWMNDSEDSMKLSTVCATPASSPRVSEDLSLEISPNPINPCINTVSNSSLIINYQNNISVDKERLPQGSVASPLSLQGCVVVSPHRSDQSASLTSSPPPSVELSPTPLNLSQDSTFTNVSFEGSFADASFSVHGQSAIPRNVKCSGISYDDNYECSFMDEQLSQSNNYSLHSNCSLLDSSETFNRRTSQSELNNSRFKSRSARRCYNASLSALDDSRLLQRTLRRNHNNNVSGLNDSSVLNNSHLKPVKSLGSLNKDCRKKYEQNFYRQSVNVSSSSARHMNESLDRIDTSSASFHGTSPLSSPLDLSINKGRSVNLDRSLGSKSDKQWVDRHVGQVFSPAKRVLHKNSGLSESDLCKQILDLYVSDADESGFDLAGNDATLDNSSIHCTSIDNSNMSTSLEGFQSTNLDDSSSEDEGPGLHYGTYVAPRNVVKETNVDDFTTTTVWTCYTGEAKTRKLQGRPGSVHLRGEDRHRAALDELHNMSMEKTSSEKRSVDGSPTRGNMVKGVEHEALKDQTNTAPRLSSLEMPPSLARDIQAEGVEKEIRGNTYPKTNMNQKRFDHLTMLHTAHNGQRKVRCLTMDESQNVVKYYPPPKEASRISWGQTISEMDLYRHTPRKTPVKTKPILNQKENVYPYEDDTPSPIVLTKMRKPKSLAKRYKNWPWS